MAGFVNPMDLLREYLVPPTGAINTGMEQGIKLRTLRNAEAVENAMIPYRRAQAEHLRAQTTAIPLATQHAADTLALEKAKEAGVQGIPMTDQMSKLLTGQELPRQDVSVPGMEGPNEQAIRTMVKPNIEGLKIIPTNPVPGRGFQAEDYEGATKFDVSGKIPVMPLSRKQQELVAAHDKAVEIANLTADRAKEVANINKAGRIEAANIAAARDKRENNTVNNWIAESLEKDAAGNPTPNAIQAKLKIEVASKIDKERKQTASEEAKEELAQSLARGDMTRIRDVMSLRSSGGGATALEIFNRARQINPKFSTAEIERKIKMESDYTTGKDGQSIQAFGTFLEHAGATNQAIDAIQMTSSPLVNKPINWLRKNATGDPNFQAFMVSLEPVRKEFEGFLLGGRALYAEDRKAAETILNESSSPAQVKSALKQMGHTAKARFNELNYRYRKTMGQDIQEPFSPEAIKAATSIGVDLIGKAPNSNLPAGAKTGKYNGTPSYSTDGGKTIYDMTGKRIK